MYKYLKLVKLIKVDTKIVKKYCHFLEKADQSRHMNFFEMIVLLCLADDTSKEQ